MINQNHLPLLEMARTIKVMKEKAMMERAREAGDKRIKRLERLKEENQKRAQRIKERKREAIKSYEGWKTRKAKKNTRGNAGSEGDPEISKGVWSPHLKGALSKIGKRDHPKTTGKPKTTEFGSSGITRGWWSLPGGPYGTGQLMCNTCKKSDYYAMRHTTSL